MILKCSRRKTKARVALGFYSHLSEASGFYEIPKNMLRVAEGKPYVLWPFKDLVENHRVTGNVIAPNANKVLKDLAGHAESLGFHDLAMCFRDAFDPDLRNGYAHADYVIWSDGIRLRKRNGGNPRKVSWEEFDCRFERRINFFHVLREIVAEYVASYREPKTAYSTANLPLIPQQGCHLFHTKVATNSTAKLPSIPGEGCH